MDCSPTDWLPDNFYRPPVWRLWRASYRTQNRLARDTQVDDEWVEVAMRLVAGPDSPERAGVSEDALASYELWIADREPRWVLEAQLLTSRTFAEVAAACEIPETVVDAYAQVFFDVRSKFHARDWALTMAVRSHPLNDFAGPQPAGLWKFFAFTGGPEVLDVVVAVTSNRPLPDWLRRQFTTNPRVEEQRLRLKTKLAVAALTAKGASQLGSVVELAEQLRRLDKEAGVPAGEADAYTPMVNEFFALLTRPQPARREAGVRTPPQAKTTVREQTRPEPTPVGTNNGGDHGS